MKGSFKKLSESIKSFRFKSIFIRNLMLIMLVVLIPMTALGVAFCSTIKKSVDKDITSIAESRAGNVKNMVDMMLRTADIFVIQTSVDKNVESFLYSSYQTENLYKVQSDIGKQLSSFINAHQYIHSVYIYSEKSKLVIHNNELSNIGNFNDNGWLDYYKALPIIGETIVQREYVGRYPKLISIIRSVGIEDTGKSGCIVLNIDVEKIDATITEGEEQKSYYFMNDSGGTICLSHDIKLIGKRYTDYLSLLSEENEPSDDDSDRVSSNYFYSETKSKWYDFVYIVVIPNSYFKGMIRSSVIYILLIVLSLFTSVVLITVFLSFKTYAPVKSILEFLSPGELEASQSYPYNEISYITENIKYSLNKNKKLEEELTNNLMLLNKAQIYALQVQINPHFLNNILDIIGWTAVSEMGIENKTSKMLRSLSHLLNISLDSEHYLVSIEEELEHAQIYTDLISESYGENLVVLWDTEEEIKNFKMPKLTLQPILENAIEHGIKQKRNGLGEVKISGGIVGEDIHITVVDNGVGIEENVLEELVSDLEDSSKLSNNHIGIRNVNQRIKLIFGDDYGLSVQSKKGEGTTVRIVFPKETGVRT